MKKCCEDCFFGTIFVIIFLVYAVCYVYVLVIGDPKILTDNFDCFGNVCGKTRNIYDQSSSVNMTERKFIIHTNFPHLEKSIPVCIKLCPNQTLLTNLEFSNFMQQISNLCDCRVPINMQLSQPRIGDVPLCPELPITRSVSVHGVCIPIEWKPSKIDHEIRLGFAKPENLSIIRLYQDVDFRFPWRAPLICLAVTWGLAVLTLLIVTFFPQKSIPIIFIFGNLGLIGLTVSLIVRVRMLSINSPLVNWGTNYPFISLQHYSLYTFGFLIAGFLLVLIFMNLIIILFWQSNNSWKETQLVIVRNLLQLVSDVLRELPCLIVVMPILHLIGLYIILLLSGLIVLQMCTIVEPVRMKFTGCLVLREHAWVQYGLIPAHILYSLWILKFYIALCQITNSIPVIIWYNAAAPNANIPVSLVLNTACQKFRMQSLGSVGFASLLSLLNWFPLQVLTFLRTLIRQKPLDEHHELIRLKKLWKWESLLRQLDCNIYTMIAIEQKSIAKIWTHLNTGICEQSVPIKLIELMRWCEILFTLAKLASSTTATLIAIAYFSNKPPVSQIYPYITFATFIASYLTASVVVGRLQHILSTIMICFCVQEEQRFANEVLNDEVLIGFRHEEIKTKLAFMTQVKSHRRSWSNISHLSSLCRPDKSNNIQPRGEDKFVSEPNVIGRREEISV